MMNQSDEYNVNVVIEYLRGSMDVIVHEEVRHIHPKKKLVIFVSSLSSDMKLERHLLHEKILPIVQTVAWEDGFEVMLHDPRYGNNNEEIGFDNLVWENIREAIQIASQDSDGIFFLNLLGGKYGNTLLPKYLPKDLLIDISKRKQIEDSNLVELAFKWYLLDENHVPPRYELKPMPSEYDSDYLDFVLPKLSQQLLSAVCFERFHNFEREGLMIGESLMEWECLKALSLDPKRCMFLNRSFSSDTLHVSSQQQLDLCDTVDNRENLERLQVLKSTIQHYCPPAGGISSFYHPFDSLSIDDYLNPESDEHDRYFKEFECYLVNFFTKEIFQMKKKSEDWNMWLLQKFHLPNGFFKEVIAHHSLALEKALSYSACLDWVDICCEMLHSSKSSISDASEISPSSPEISLAIIGGEGSGKSTLLSKIATALQKTFPDVPLLIRFCGTSKYNLNAMDLIQSLSIQLLTAYERQEELAAFTREMSSMVYSTAVTIFQSFLTKYPVFVLLDSIEELSDLYGARSELSFLLHFQPHPQTRIILTVNSKTSSTPLSSGSRLSTVCCEKVLVAKQVPRFIIDLAGRVEESLAILLRTKKNLQLQPRQWAFVQQQLPKQETTANFFYLTLLTYSMIGRALK